MVSDIFDLLYYVLLRMNGSFLTTIFLFCLCCVVIRWGVRFKL